MRSILSSPNSIFSFVLSSVLLKSTLNGLLPRELFPFLHKLWNRLSPQHTIFIEESVGKVPNQVFASANTYLASKVTDSTPTIKVYKSSDNDHLVVSLDTNQDFYDSFEGVTFKWVLRKKEIIDSMSVFDKKCETHVFELSFHKKYSDMVLNSYLPYILKIAKEIVDEKKMLKIHNLSGGSWDSINLNHPATFDSIAMEPKTKRELLEDLHSFTQRKEYYRRVGKAWKRGYLLYGPPGTGKSSLIAAIANHLKFDIYDLNLSAMEGDSDLRYLLMNISNRSIIVIEDIDCSMELHNREKDDKESNAESFGNFKRDKITLSGLLNFMDGLWTSFGDERIIICTTNHKDSLDPALLRPGRMDVHIHMSYCSFNVFKTLAVNYLQVEEHALFDDIKELFKKVEVTPAEVAGELMKSVDVDKALKGLINFLHIKLL